jgi:uncharacterized spore protein YtfJ
MSGTKSARLEANMTVTEIMETARDALNVKRVFGDPYERDGVTVIPVAAIRGGGGGGTGEGEGGEGKPGGTGTGGGFGAMAKPAGVYVISGDDVRWQPAVDVNRIVLGGQIVAIVLFLTLRSLFKRR